jgi:two-component system nitrate/nitrite response regulator NarL
VAEAVLRSEPTNGTSPLTPRELEVLRLLAIGANTKTAAEKLGVSPATIRNHVQNLLGKLGVHSRLQAVAHATAHGLLS